MRRLQAEAGMWLEVEIAGLEERHRHLVKLIDETTSAAELARLARQDAVARAEAARGETASAEAERVDPWAALDTEAPLEEKSKALRHRLGGDTG